MCAANTIGAIGVFLFLSYVLPLPNKFNPADKHHVIVVNLVTFILYTVAAAAVGWVVSAGRLRPIRRWLREDSDAEALRDYVLRHPLRQTMVHAAIWAASELVFVPLNAPYGAAGTADIATSILLGGITTCTITYFAAERLLRPITEAVLDGHSMPDPYVPGVKTRIISAWALGTGVPVVAIVLLVLDRHHQRLSVGSVLFLAVAGLVAGAVTMAFAARSVADPVESVTAALAKVEDGRFDVTVPVYDGSQVGRLQSGFNAMVEGLREREQIREMFGRQVGEDVAAQALERGLDFDGETVHATVLFVDVIGSTRLATQLAPKQLVAALNAFFTVVVEVVSATGGFVNKFEGDAALCVFGVPTARPDTETCALQAARTLHERLRADSSLQAAIGVACGDVVAGNIGTDERYEYTVIGDPVNVAARLCELAKQYDDHVLVTEEVVASAKPEEQARWESSGDVELRGRSGPTGLAVPMG